MQNFCYSKKKKSFLKDNASIPLYYILIGLQLIIMSMTQNLVGKTMQFNK